MSYRSALGYDIDINTPLGVQKVSFDLDKVSKDVSDAIVAQAYPQFESRARQSIPTFVQDAYKSAQPLIVKERDAAFDEAQGRITKIGLALLAGLGVTLIASNLLSSSLTGGSSSSRARARSKSPFVI